MRIICNSNNNSSSRKNDSSNSRPNNENNNTMASWLWRGASFLLLPGWKDGTTSFPNLLVYVETSTDIAGHVHWSSWRGILGKCKTVLVYMFWVGYTVYSVYCILRGSNKACSLNNRTCNEKVKVRPFAAWVGLAFQHSLDSLRTLSSPGELHISDFFS